MIKVIHVLGGECGLSIRLYDSIENIPLYCKQYKTMTRNEILCFYSPSAEHFWEELLYKSTNFNWKTIITDKTSKSK